jgi:hypothetical protein
VRIFKAKTFARFARRERIADVSLSEAIAQAERGLVDADLGGGLIKLRLARPGQGKRGGYRMLIAFRSKLRAVFLFGFAKNELDNIDDDQLSTLRETAALWLAANAQKIEQAIKDGLLIEVRDDDQKENQRPLDQRAAGNGKGHAR